MHRNRTLRPLALERDAMTCRGSWRCRLRGPRAAEELEVDHVHELQDGGPDELGNLRTLCKTCHLRKTNRERARRDLVLTRALVRYSTLFGAAALAVRWFLTPATFPSGIEALAILILSLAAAGLLHDRPHWFRRRRRGPRPEPVAAVPADGEAQRLERSLAKLFGPEESYSVRQTKEGLVLDYAGTDLDTENESTWARVERIASSKLGGRWVAEDDGVNDRALIRRRREFPATIAHPGLEDPTRRWSWLPWGETEQGGVAAVDLMVTAHVLVTGATGAGKTSLMRSLIVALADSGTRGEVELHLFDPKVVEMAEYANLPGVVAVHSSDEEVYDALVHAAEQMRERYKSGRPDDFPALVLVIDEMRVLRSRMWKVAAQRSTLHKDDPRSCPKPTKDNPGPALEAIEEILFLGRTGNVRIIAGIQRPDAKSMGGDVRAQMEGRLLVGHPDPDGARMMFGSTKWGADIPVRAKGRTTVQLFEDRPEECQAWWTTPVVA